MACGGLSYLCAVISGYLAAVAPVFHTGLAALDALQMAGGLAVACGALLGLDTLLARRRRAARPHLVAL